MHGLTTDSERAAAADVPSSPGTVSGTVQPCRSTSWEAMLPRSLYLTVMVPTMSGRWKSHWNLMLPLFVNVAVNLSLAPPSMVVLLI